MPKLDHVALEVSDMDRAVAFYSATLGFTLRSRAVNKEQQEEYCFLDGGGAMLELIRDVTRSGPVHVPNKRPYCPHICFQTEDMQQTLKQLKADGVDIFRGPFVIKGEETWVYFRDPDGNVLEYIQWLHNP